jgi:hypothetical protein
MGHKKSVECDDDCTDRKERRFLKMRKRRRNKNLISSTVVNAGYLAA